MAKEKEIKNLNEELRKELEKYKKYYDRDKEELMESCYSLAKENKKLKDEFMMKLAMYYNLPPTSNEMARLKEWNYSKRYDEVKNAMRRELMEWD